MVKYETCVEKYSTQYKYFTVLMGNLDFYTKMEIQRILWH